MYKPMLVFVAVVLIATVSHVDGHGRLIRPAGRSTLWRLPEFASQNPPPNYDDHQLYCGGALQNDHPGTNCGVCGDPISDSRPRPNENGGMYARGIIAARYSAGQVIDVQVDITAAHNGYMEFRLCDNVNDESQSCFNRNLLQQAYGGGSWVMVDRGPGTYNAQMRLPDNVRCNRCVIQWNYRGAQHNPADGPQENFRGCADVVIN